MNSYELAAWAVKTGGKVRYVEWAKRCWIFYNGSIWLNEDGDSRHYPNFDILDCWEKYEEPEPEVSREFNCPHCDKEIAVLRKEEAEK